MTQIGPYQPRQCPPGCLACIVGLIGALLSCASMPVFVILQFLEHRRKRKAEKWQPTKSANE
jgi:uncharacterized membrane protein YbaN (DUF454 family)